MTADAIKSSRVLGPELFRLAIEGCPNGMVVVCGDGAILLVNGEIERLFGYRRDELLGRPIEILLPETLRTEHAEHRHAFSLQPEMRHYGTERDFKGRRKDGSEFPVEVGLNPIKLGGELIVVGAIADISERKRLQQLQDEFVATVSHELRTPMTSIAASLGLLDAGVSSQLPQPAAHLLKIAHMNCQRLILLINDILDIKKLETGKVAFNFSRCDARLLLEEAIESNRGFADGFGVHIRLDTGPGAFDVDTDPDRFAQVITNLLSNAVKFSPTGSEVAVAIARHGGNVRITMRDHGIGIPAKFKPHIFEKFAQADAAPDRAKGGSGLGLSIVRELVARVHGRVGFDDAPGGGTIFHVELPCAVEMTRAPEIAAARA